MQFSSRLATVAFAFAAIAFQAEAKSLDLGVVGSSGATFGNSFSSDTSFTDYYTFTLAAPSDVSGSTVDTSYIMFFSKDVTLSSLVLTAGSSSTVVAQDLTPSSFTFSGLSAGSYTLQVNGAVSGFLGGSGSYSGSLKAVASSVASAAPEPADLALTALGLAGVGFMVRRRAGR